MLIINEEDQNKDSVAVEPLLQKNKNKAKNTHLIATATIGIVLAILFCIAYMFRYEVIVVQKEDGSTFTIAQYLVKDRWTGDIEAVWQDTKGNVRQSKYHPFDGGRNDN
jgi:hypothetical protein